MEDRIPEDDGWVRSHISAVLNAGMYNYVVQSSRNKRRGQQKIFQLHKDEETLPIPVCYTQHISIYVSASKQKNE